MAHRSSILFIASLKKKKKTTGQSYLKHSIGQFYNSKKSVLTVGKEHIGYKLQK